MKDTVVIVLSATAYRCFVRAVKSLNKIIRSKGVVPATVAILNGRIHVGMSIKLMC